MELVTFYAKQPIPPYHIHQGMLIKQQSASYTYQYYVEKYPRTNCVNLLKWQHITLNNYQSKDL